MKNEINLNDRLDYMEDGIKRMYDIRNRDADMLNSNFQVILNKFEQQAKEIKKLKRSKATGAALIGLGLLTGVVVGLGAAIYFGEQIEEDYRLKDEGDTATESIPETAPYTPDWKNAFEEIDKVAKATKAGDYSDPIDVGINSEEFENLLNKKIPTVNFDN